MEWVIGASAVIVAVSAAVAAIIKAVAWMLRTARNLARLADDLLGQPAHGDEPARPGLMERLRRVEVAQARIENRLGVLEELRPNGGGSIKDQVTRIARATGADQH